MRARKIQPVADNRDKQRTYREQIERFNRAMKEEFYFEAIMIDYALMEDRLHSMIYHMGFLPDRMSAAIYRQTRPDLVAMVTDCMGEKEAAKLGISKISGKMKIIRSVLYWADHVEGGYQDNKFLSALKSQCECMDIGGLLQILDEIAVWLDYRNELVHAMMNKNVDSLYAALRERAEEGMRLARFVDAQERLLKKGHKIRRSIDLPTDR